LRGKKVTDGGTEDVSGYGRDNGKRKKVCFFPSAVVLGERLKKV
jgi:hypothetical protein